MRLGNLGRCATIAACVVLASCATSRSEVRLGAGSMPVAAARADGGGRPIVIRSVKDLRVFEVAPKDPSIPSLGFEGSAQASADVKARAIGRKRNAYGMALGDVLLEPGENVENVVRMQFASALREAGYRVVAAGLDTASAPVVDVRIRQFWSWINPGFWSISLSTAIMTELQVEGASAPAIVAVRNVESLAFVPDSAWIDAIDKALQRYRAEVVARKAALP